MIIRRKVDKIQLKIALLYDQIRMIQDFCPHTNVEKIPHSNSGDYDYATTEYWYDITCSDCSKKWREPQ
jgi:hypothetical protein